ncbi:TPA: sel1 repeat family protein [Klebsiella pneumoniae]|uniref:tetratricopeptide repeat protein n=1 Tax=Klebsiella pneumoniae TaxID=573 RepID=UPI00132F5B0B|nr:SEL1-like repeat protein [Klebsiella pneumoniae]HBT3928928.1 sel1 repeat family protein [Klebsiella pneumoniae]HBT3940171.1 sel1 repeat family protein [Klebsiella pneumoniae]
MKYLFLFLLVFTSGAAVATEPGSQYQQQAEAGDRRAQYYLADTWVSSGDYQKAEYWAQKAAAQGDGDAAVDAQMLLGLIYASGVHGPEDDVKASEYFKGSSSLSRTGYAEYWAGMMFQQGEKGFIEPNKQKALHWLNVSCLEGFDTGCEEFDRISKG